MKRARRKDIKEKGVVGRGGKRYALASLAFLSKVMYIPL
jgi:hypothetical protein